LEAINLDNILSQEELLDELNEFKSTLKNFDYSCIDNIVFINLESLYCYVENIENNPFRMQYEKLQKILDIIEPYIPFTTQTEFINIIDTFQNLSELDNIKRAFSLKKRINFINYVNLITTEDEWQDIINICENIRNTYEKEI